MSKLSGPGHLALGFSLWALVNRERPDTDPLPVPGADPVKSVCFKPSTLFEIAVIGFMAIGMWQIVAGCISHERGAVIIGVIAVVVARKLFFAGLRTTAYLSKGGIDIVEGILTFIFKGTLKVLEQRNKELSSLIPPGGVNIVEQQNIMPAVDKLDKTVSRDVYALLLVTLLFPAMTMLAFQSVASIALALSWANLEANDMPAVADEQRKKAALTLNFLTYIMLPVIGIIMLVPEADDAVNSLVIAMDAGIILALTGSAAAIQRALMWVGIAVIFWPAAYFLIWTKEEHRKDGFLRKLALAALCIPLLGFALTNMAYASQNLVKQTSSATQASLVKGSATSTKPAKVRIGWEQSLQPAFKGVVILGRSQEEGTFTPLKWLDRKAESWEHRPQERGRYGYVACLVETAPSLGVPEIIPALKEGDLCYTEQVLDVPLESHAGPPNE